jgi:hypothetical protein
MLHAFDQLELKSYLVINSLNVPILRIIQSHFEISDLKHAEVQTGLFMFALILSIVSNLY